MTPQEFGELIRIRREANGLTVEELAARIKLSARVLRSIEQGVLEGLPHAVYARAFVRSYASSAGLSNSEVDEGVRVLFPDCIFDDVTPLPGPIDRQRASGKKRSGGDRLVASLLIFVVVVLPLLAGWFVISQYGSDIMELIKRPLSAAPASPKSETSAPESLPANASQGATASGQTAARVPAAAPAPAMTPVVAETREGNATMPSAAAPDAARSAETPATAPAPAGTVATAAVDTTPEGQPITGNRVSIEARAECWVQAMADGAPSRTVTLQQGQTSVFPFTKKLVLTLGNSGEVAVRYNGKPFSFSAKANEARTLTFPPRQ